MIFQSCNLNKLGHLGYLSGVQNAYNTLCEAKRYSLTESPNRLTSLKRMTFKFFLNDEYGTN